MTVSWVNMIIEQTSDLGKDAIENPQKYNGFLGVSILHKFFSKTNMKFYFEWSSKQFKEFIVLLMDDPDRYNFRVFKKIPGNAALKHAREISDELKNGYGKTLRGLKISNIRIVQFRDFVEDAAYQSILWEIYNHFDSDDEFRKDLFHLMDIGIGSKIKELPYQQDDIEKIREILANYIIQELASILYWTEHNYPIELDPTVEFTTKKRIYDGDFPELYSKLRLTRRGHIFIHPEGILKNSF